MRAAGLVRPDCTEVGLDGGPSAVIASAAKQSMPRRGDKWIASRSLSSGAHSRDPVARNDGAGSVG